MDSTMIGQDRRRRAAAPAGPRGGRRPGGDGAAALLQEAPRRRPVPGRVRPGSGVPGTGLPGGPGPGTGRRDGGRRVRGRPEGGRPGVRRQSTERLAAVPGRARSLASGARVPRAPFVLLVLSLLGGGLICLLVINTTLGAASFEIDRLQQSANARTLQEQQLQEQLASEQNLPAIEREACALGMRPQQRLEFLNPHTRRVYESPSGAATPAWCSR
jgi:hypothetical protein